MYVETSFSSQRWNKRKQDYAGGGGGGATVSASSSYHTDVPSSRSNMWTNRPQSRRIPPSSNTTNRALPENRRQDSFPVSRNPLSRPDYIQGPSDSVDYGDELTRRCGISEAGSSHTTSCTTSSPEADLNTECSTFFYQPIDECTQGPGSLSPYVVEKLRERFEKRVLKRPAGKTPDCDGTGVRIKYQLIAAFLVNQGIVEAWHVYTPMPNDALSTWDEGICETRTMELTQRRMRLLQRYYSNARQYVVLYVNSTRAEHYLPLGLAEDPNRGFQRSKSSQLFRSTSQTSSNHSHTRVMTRILTSILPSFRTSVDKQDVDKSNRTPVDRSGETRHFESCKVALESKSHHSPDFVPNKLQRRHSLPQVNSTQQQQQQQHERRKTRVRKKERVEKEKEDEEEEEEEEEEKSPNEIPTSPTGVTQTRRTATFMQRFIDHFIPLKNTRSLRRCKSPDQSTGTASQPSSEYQVEKESSSSALNDVNSTSGSDLNDPVQQGDDMEECIHSTTRTSCRRKDFVEKRETRVDSQLDQNKQIEVWLPQ